LAKKGREIKMREHKTKHWERIVLTAYLYFIGRDWGEEGGSGKGPKREKTTWGLEMGCASLANWTHLRPQRGKD